MSKSANKQHDFSNIQKMIELKNRHILKNYTQKCTQESLESQKSLTFETSATLVTLNFLFTKKKLSHDHTKALIFENINLILKLRRGQPFL